MESKRSSEECCPQPMDGNGVLVHLSFRVDEGFSDKFCNFCIDKSANGGGKNNNTASCNELHPSSSMGRSLKVPWTFYFQQNSKGNTLFHWAIVESKSDFVLSIIQAVSDPSYLNITNNSLETPLLIAAWMRRADVMKSLVCAGADITLLDDKDQSAMHISVTLGHLAGVKALMAPLGNSFPMNKLLADLYNRNGYACVHLATHGGHMEILTYLVQSVGANINAGSVLYGDTCLHMACLSENEELVCTLLNLGADPGLKNYDDFTPYELAREKGLFTMQRLLARRGVVDENDIDFDDVGYHSDYEMI